MEANCCSLTRRCLLWREEAALTCKDVPQISLRNVQNYFFRCVYVCKNPSHGILGRFSLWGVGKGLQPIGRRCAEGGPEKPPGISKWVGRRFPSEVTGGAKEMWANQWPDETFAGLGVGARCWPPPARRLRLGMSHVWTPVVLSLLGRTTRDWWCFFLAKGPEWFARPLTTDKITLLNC